MTIGEHEPLLPRQARTTLESERRQIWARIRAYCIDLCESTEEAWRGQGWTPASFPYIAQAALQARPFLQAASAAELEDLLLWFPTQDSVFLSTPSFGDPGVELYATRFFSVHVHWWTWSSTDLHCHSWSGAFQSVQGDRIEAQYNFKPETALGPWLQKGAMALSEYRAIDEGETHLVLPSPKLVHRIFHTSVPGISVVLRLHHDAFAEREGHYTHNGFKVASDKSFSITSRFPNFAFAAQYMPETWVQRVADGFAELDPSTVAVISSRILDQVGESGGDPLAAAEIMGARLVDKLEPLKTYVDERAREQILYRRRFSATSKLERFAYSLALDRPPTERALAAHKRLFQQGVDARELYQQLMLTFVPELRGLALKVPEILEVLVGASGSAQPWQAQAHTLSEKVCEDAVIGAFMSRLRLHARQSGGSPSP